MSSPLPTDRAARGAAGSAHLPGLDGLRALAVILVVVYHLFPQWWVAGGFIGVDVFFVISGFLITTLLLRERDANGRISLVGFWKRRARRLLPALVLLLLVCSTAAWVIGGDVLVRLGAQILGALTFSYNWVAILIGEGYFGGSTPELFRNLWSLGIEEQFYVLWPLVLPLVLLLPRTWARVTAASALAVASAVWMGDIVATTGEVSRAYYGTDSHAFGILLGVAIAFGLHRLLTAPSLWMQRAAVRRGIGVMGVAAVLGVIGISLIPPADTIRTFPLTIAAASILSGLAIIAAVWPHGRFGHALDIPPLRWIGERSYGLYLWHWPLLVLLVAAVQGTAPEAGVPVWVGVVTLGLTVLIAEASYRLLETPIRRRGFRDTWRQAQAAVRIESRALWASVVGGLATAALVAGTLAGALSGATVSSGEAVVAQGQAAVDAASASPTPTADVAPEPDPAPAPGTFADGARRPPAPSPTPISGSDVNAVGDSVMLAAAPSLFDTMPGIRLDAAESRSSWAGPGIVGAWANAGQLGRYLVIALGTNGPISWDAYERMAATAGPDRTLVLVNAYAPRDWIPGVNSDIAAFAASHPGTVIADWAGAIDPHVDTLAGDRIHPGTSGGRIYADTVLAAIRQAENQRAIDAYVAETRAYRDAHREDARIAQ
ncbi:acyltransferase family protein [Microbacterium sp. bgisy207]|uniref:acyltransferase family protein n=1 Tax=Microbacterium sp. bgisy207 TaxID=3413800 RepID=UPI003EBDD38C